MHVGEGKHLFFNKSGDAVFGRVVPSAYTTNNPWPPGATNLNKNKVHRPSFEESCQVLKETQEHFDREAQHASHFYIVPPKGKENSENYKPATRRRIPEIEMAIYWDRNPYRHKQSLLPVNPNSLMTSKERSKSAANVSSLQEWLKSADSVDIREEPVKKNSLRTETDKQTEIHEKGCPAAVTSQSPEISSEPAIVAEAISSPLQHPSNSKNASSSECEEDKGSPKEIKSEHKSKRHSSASSGKEGVDIVKELVKQARRSNRVKSVSDFKSVDLHASFEEDINPEKEGVRAVGVQVTSDKVSLAALKSIYLCPLHGQYKKKEKERLEKANFKESLTNSVHPDNMNCGRCSGHHSRYRARSVSSCKVSSKNDQDTKDAIDIQNEKRETSAKKKAARSKTAKSEYANNYRHPKQLSSVYNRQLRNKILSYCFTKHSVF